MHRISAERQVDHVDQILHKSEAVRTLVYELDRVVNRFQSCTIETQPDRMDDILGVSAYFLAKSADLRDSAFSGQILSDVQVFLNFVSLTSPYKLTQTVLVVYGYIQIRTPRFQPHPSLFLLFCQVFRTFACRVLCGFDFLTFLPYLLRYVATAFLLLGFRLCVPFCSEIKA